MDFVKKIADLTNKLEGKTIKIRRDFHRYAEAGWTEFRTAAVVAEELTKLGYRVAVGDEVMDAENMMGVPPVAELNKYAGRAIEQGANPEWVSKMEGGKTGVVGIMNFVKPGPTVALRFDLDANEANEAEVDRHRPYDQRFSSINKGVMHACGHDGHTAVGLAIAEVIAELKDDLHGEIKLIFQPAEEGARGAKAMVAKGIVDDVDYLLGMHFGFQLKKTGQIACNVKGLLATSKYDAIFIGVPAHAGSAPETGKNALLAAATAVLNLHAITRHGQGASRINVGTMYAGSGRNVIPQKAVIKLETRGETSAINQFMSDEAHRIINSAASMYGVSVDVLEMGGAVGCINSPELSRDLTKIAENLGAFTEILPECDFGASEDCSYFMKRVQEHGGQAAYIMIGADLAAGHHNTFFDFDEKALGMAIRFVSIATVDLLFRQS